MESEYSNVCTTCGATVFADFQEKHDDYHATLNGFLAGLHAQISTRELNFLAVMSETDEVRIEKSYQAVKKAGL